MKRKIALVILGCTLITGCAKHYSVTDASSGKTYYTKKVHHRSGSVNFTDAGGSDVTLSNAEVKKISKKDYKDATSN